MTDFSQRVEDYLNPIVEEVFDKGVIAGLNLALKLAEACQLHSYPVETLIHSITSLRDNPPPKEKR